MSFYDINGKTWYPWLNDKNQVYLSGKPPFEDAFFVYYINNGAEGLVEDDNNGDKGYTLGDTTVVQSADGLKWDDHDFIEWNTKADGTGDSYVPGDKLTITGDIDLYAIFKERKKIAGTFYSGGDCSKEIKMANLALGTDSVAITAPDLEELGGWEPAGWSIDEAGYSVSYLAGSEITLAEDTSFYGIYKKEVELSYDANGWSDVDPAVQSGVRYARVYNDITYLPASLNTAPALARASYSFVGWSASRKIDESSHIYKPDESIELEDSVTLYAQMIDDIAPVLGEASYNSGYKGIGNWLIRKKDLVITVPVTEEGSGVNKIVYILTPENGDTVTGEASMEEAYLPGQVRRSAAVQYTAAGRQPRRADGQVGTTDGQIQARITISEDYKGTVTLKCLDNAGNESPDKLLTATGGGVIVEDNAPQINFTNKDIKGSTAVVTVSVSDDVDTDKSNQVTGGIAGITYLIDDKPEQNVTARNFEEEIVPSCEFSVNISGSGKHTLKVTAIDNAGNESRQSTQVIIAAKSKVTTVIRQDNKQSSKQSRNNQPAEIKNEFVPLVVKQDKPESPKDSEPATGGNSIQVEVYATIAMTAGLLCILLDFIIGNNGMTEEEKNETVSRIVNWAKKGGRFRKCAAIAAIFCVLFYYHSIGKRIDVEWNEVVSP